MSTERELTGKDFLNATMGDEFAAVKHNPIDYDSFHEFSDYIEKRYHSIEHERSKRERMLSLKRWDEGLASPWNQAKLDQLFDKAAAQRAVDLMKEYKWASFYIYGPSGSGKTFLGLAIARRYIGAGLVRPSQVKHLSEERLMTQLRAGFTGQRFLDEVFSERYRLYLFDNIGSKRVYTEQQIAIWELLLEHVSLNNLAVIFTSNQEPQIFQDKLSEATASKFGLITQNRIIRMTDEVKGPASSPATLDFDVEESADTTLLNFGREDKKLL